MRKNKRTIKKYAIHILAITAVKEDTFDLPRNQNAIIVCTARENKLVNLCEQKNILILNFPDSENKKLPFAFNEAHARKIINFIDSLTNDVTDLYVCCSKGGSRSPAVAAALLKMSGRSDLDVWRNPFYVPNTLVYYKLCHESGIKITHLYVWILTKMNTHSFKKAQKGHPCKYERWQILN